MVVRFFIIEQGTHVLFPELDGVCYQLFGVVTNFYLLFKIPVILDVIGQKGLLESHKCLLRFIELVVDSVGFTQVKDCFIWCRFLAKGPFPVTGRTVFCCCFQIFKGQVLLFRYVKIAKAYPVSQIGIVRKLFKNLKIVGEGILILFI